MTVQDNFGESDVAQIRIIVKAENEKVESMNGLILIEMLLGFNIIIIMTIVILILSRRKWKGYLVKRTE